MSELLVELFSYDLNLLKIIYKSASDAATSFKIELKNLTKLYEKDIKESDYVHKNDILNIITNSKDFMKVINYEISNAYFLEIKTDS